MCFRHVTCGYQRKGFLAQNNQLCYETRCTRCVDCNDYHYKNAFRFFHFIFIFRSLRKTTKIYFTIKISRSTKHSHFEWHKSGLSIECLHTGGQFAKSFNMSMNLHVHVDPEYTKPQQNLQLTKANMLTCMCMHHFWCELVLYLHSIEHDLYFQNGSYTNSNVNKYKNIR